MNPVTYWRMAVTPKDLQRKSGLAPTGVLRQKPVHSSSQSLNIRLSRGERQTGQGRIFSDGMVTMVALWEMVLRSVFEFGESFFH
jgi:hypothetical protein